MEGDLTSAKEIISSGGRIITINRGFHNGREFAKRINGTSVCGHFHTTYSNLALKGWGEFAGFHYYDSLMTPRQVVETAKTFGINALMPADHDTFEGIEPLSELALRENIVTIPSVEISIPSFGSLYPLGHLLAICNFSGRSQEFEEVLQLAKACGKDRDKIFELINIIHSLGGLAIPAHPFAGPYSWKLREAWPCLDGLEIFTAYTLTMGIKPTSLDLFFENVGFTEKKPLLLMGIDAHRPWELRQALTVIERSPQSLKTPQDIINAFRSENLHHFFPTRNLLGRSLMFLAGIITDQIRGNLPSYRDIRYPQLTLQQDGAI